MAIPSDVVSDKALAALANSTRLNVDGIGGLEWYRYAFDNERRVWLQFKMASVDARSEEFTIKSGTANMNAIFARVVAANVREYGADYYARLKELQDKTILAARGIGSE
jgi:hypothetical protein